MQITEITIEIFRNKTKTDKKKKRDIEQPVLVPRCGPSSGERSAPRYRNRSFYISIFIYLLFLSVFLLLKKNSIVI